MTNSSFTLRIVFLRALLNFCEAKSAGQHSVFLQQQNRIRFVIESMRNEFQNSKIGFRSEKFQKKQSFRFKKRRKPKISFFRVPKKGLAVAASLFQK